MTFKTDWADDGNYRGAGEQQRGGRRSYQTPRPEEGGTITLGARIFKLLRSPRIDSEEPIPPGCVAWRPGTTTLFLLGT
jgi:hypothetical protein